MGTKPFKLVVRALIKDEEDKILMLKRSVRSRSNPGRWELPGGKVEPGEDFDQALIREIKEETGLSITLKKPLGVAQQEHGHRHSLHLIMLVELDSGKLSISDEHEEYQWIKINKIPTLKLANWMENFLKHYSLE